jgi:RyR domain/TrkA-N domain
MKIRDLEWWIIGALGLIAFFLAMIGFNIMFTEAGVHRNLLDLAFQSMKIFAMEFVDEFRSPLPWQLEAARWLAPGVLLYTAGKTILYFIRRELKSFLLKFYKNHIIVTSLNDKSRYLIKDLLKNGEKVIVLAGIENPRKLDLVEKNGAVIIEGDITDKNFLKNISAHKAKYFVFLEDDDEKNISNAISVYNYLIEFGKDKKQTIFTHVADDIKLSELIELNFFEEFTTASEINKSCEIRIFSMNERTSRILFNKYPPDIFTPVTADSPQIRVAIFGSGKLAQSMVIRLARLGHYANLKKMSITLFHYGSTTVNKLLRNFPGITELVKLENIDEQLELFDIEEFNKLNKEQRFDVLYLLCEDDSISSGILKKLTEADSPENLNVVLTLTNPEGILSKWYKADLIDNINLSKFNLIEESFTKEALISEKIDELAKIIHQNYLNKLKKRNPDKPSHQDWEFLPIDFKNQNREQADHIYIKIRAAGCKAVNISDDKAEFKFENNLELVEILAAMEHNRWWAHMILSGWKFGKDRDDKKKIHPYLIPYEELTEEIKQYDRDTVLNMPKLLEKLGKKIVKADKHKT